MTETISNETRYGFDDMRVGDRVKITNGNGDVLIAEVSAASPGEPVEVTAFGREIDVYREDGIELISRPDPVQDVIDAWVIEGPAKGVHRAARAQLVKSWPTLGHALDRLAETRA